MNLTHTEQRVADCLPGGMADREIAHQLKMKLPTEKIHVRRIIEKLGARNRTDAAVKIDRARTGR